MISSRKGYTIVEILLVITVLSMTLAIGGFTLNRSRNNVSLDSSVLTLLSDLRGQQIKVMNGAVVNGEASMYQGVYFEETRYVLFSSQLYDPHDESNYTIDLDSDNIFSVINLPDDQIIFSEDGEIENFDPIRNFITLTNTNSNTQKTLFINLYGSIYEVN